MGFKVIRQATIAAAILVASVFAQADSTTNAQLLQKGIYAQQTSGDLDSAIQIFRQILTSAPDRALAAQAQLHLAQAMLQKGELNNAAVEFQVLATSYPEFGKVIAATSRHTSMPLHNPSITKGTFEHGRYHHNATGVEFDVPQGWALQGDVGSSGGGEIVVLYDLKTGAQGKIWLISETGNARTEDALRNDLARKHEDRNGNWKVRAESVSMGSVAGQMSLNAVADYNDNKGVKLTEFLLWVRSAKSHVLFFGDTATSSFSEFQAAFQQVIASAYIP